MRRSAEFAAALRGGTRAGGDGLVVHARPDAFDGPARVGFIVGRSVGPAVVRNRVRRRLRHLVRARLSALPRGSLLVVRATPAAGRRSYAELGSTLDRALTRTSTPGGHR